MLQRILLVGAAALLAAQSQAPDGERLAMLRNLGKAFYENPTTHKQSAETLGQVVAANPSSAKDRLNWGLALLRSGETQKGMAELERVQKAAPEIPHTWFNLAIQWKKFGETDKALEQIRQFVKLAPNDPPGHYNLGVLLRQKGDLAGAVAAFEKTAQLEARLFGPHFQLFNLYRQMGQAEKSRSELALFQKRKQEREGDPIPEDLEWSWFSELLDDAVPEALTPPAKNTYRDAVTAVAADAGTAVLTPVAEGLLVASTKGVYLVSGAGTVLKSFPAPAFAAAAGDADNDGKTDFAVVRPDGVTLYKAVGSAVPLAKGAWRSALFVDFDHDYDLDLLLLGDRNELLRNEGDKGFRPHAFPFTQKPARRAGITRMEPDSKAIDVAIAYMDGTAVMFRDQLLGAYRSEPLQDRSLLSPRAEMDVNRDGQIDQFAVSAAGRLVRRINTTVPKTNWITVSLEGVKNLKQAHTADVEIKAGGLYQKRFYTGAPLTFDLRGYKTVDVVRITWPNGLIQNETKQAANRAYLYKEAQRLSGSCPQVWTWDGKGFRYITDVLGVAPLGASSGDGEYFPVDHDEYIQIPRGGLVARDGRFEIRVTEELAEVAYMDQVELVAVDHPAGADLYTNDKFKAPPFPEFKLFAAKTKIFPVKREGNEFDFGGRVPKRALLVAHGWVDWADGSEFLRASQTAREQLRFPRLEQQQADGSWKTLVEDMGLPAGKPKTIVVELSDLGPGKLRIDTNLAAHYDSVFLTPDVDVVAATVRRAAPVAASLRFRGFSRVTVHPTRAEPERFDYDAVSPVSMWNPTPGMYTRYGDVRELISSGDDRLVVMGSGDEMVLEFADAFGPVAAGMQRDYLLKVEGWAKDRDPNTAYSRTVGPLPFRGMSRYPYPAGEKHPGGDWIAETLTRPALNLMRPLVSRRAQ
jgi:tetratricopeptide (TPR) repeat protein